MVAREANAQRRDSDTGGNSNMGKERIILTDEQVRNVFKNLRENLQGNTDLLELLDNLEYTFDQRIGLKEREKSIIHESAHKIDRERKEDIELIKAALQSSTDDNFRKTVQPILRKLEGY